MSLPGRIALAIITFIGITAGIYFFIVHKIDGIVSKQAEEIKITESLSGPIKHLISRAEFNDDNHSYGNMIEASISTPSKPDFKKYLFFHDGIMGGVQTNMDAIYSISINQKLGTDQFQKEASLDGIIIRHTGSKELQHGEYKAYRLFHTLTFISLPNRVVIYRDTVWGTMPKITITSDVINGKEPTDDDDIAAVKKIL